MKTRLSGVERRRLLLDATETLVLERGVNAVTVEAVADRAAVTKGLIYHFFDDREGLLAALMDRANDSFRAHVEVLLAQAGAFDAKLRVLARVTVAPPDSYGVLAALAGVQSKSGALAQSQARQSVAVALTLRDMVRDEFGIAEQPALVLAATALSSSAGFGTTWRTTGWTVDEAAENFFRIGRAIIDEGVAIARGD